jgi:hypothetical protein
VISTKEATVGAGFTPARSRKILLYKILAEKGFFLISKYKKQLCSRGGRV